MQARGFTIDDQNCLWSLLLLGVAAGAVARASVAETISRLNVFLIAFDALRAGHVPCYEYSPIKTPALDKLAKEGVRFAQAFTTIPITNVSHTSILTGLLPGPHGVTPSAPSGYFFRLVARL
jgi:arylsulfatase A-like enzyme